MNQNKEQVYSRLVKKFSEDESNDYIFAKHPNCPIFILEKIVNRNLKKNNLAVLCEVAANPNCPRHVLEKLSKEFFHKTGADYPDCTIFDCQPYAILAEVAGNPNCPISTLEKLAKHESLLESLWVRSEVAKNHNCPLPVLKQLAEDSEDRVREGVVTHALDLLDLRDLCEKER